MLSPKQGWSSCSVILWICEQHKIIDLYCTTLRIGKKELRAICERIDLGLIDHCHFCLCDISKENNKEGKHYDYDDFLLEKQHEYNFELSYQRNHSKIILCDCESDKYIIETSSNLNENPKIEQFAITNDDKLFKWYMQQFRLLRIFR